MKIYAKLSLISLTLTVAPLLIVLAFFYRYSNDSIKSEIFSKLEVITKLKADKLEKFFENCRSDLTNNRSHISARTYLPVLARLVGARDNVAYVEAKRIMDTQLNIFLESHPHFSDIILLDVRGQIVYTANPDHTSLIGRRLPGPDPEAFEKAKAGIYVGQIFSSEDKKYPYGMLLAAPVYDNQNQFCGVVAHLLDAEAIYRITQDKTGLEHSGETLLVRRLSDAAVLFISPLRYEPNAVLHKQIPIGGPHGIAAQRAVQGKNGIGRSSDYRGVDTLSCWRYLPGLGWG
ncbi:MAG: cache domain-containing protein, partial [Candidatus Omnitrophota bacterium]